MSLEEDRYQIQLAWDRSKFFMLLVSSLTAAGTALVRVGNAPVVVGLASLTFVAAGLIAVGGLLALGEGKEYHRRAVAKSVLLGDKLGLTDPWPERGDQITLQLVSGMSRAKAVSIASTPTTYVSPRIRKGGFTAWVRITFIALIVANAVGVLVSIYIAVGCPIGGCGPP